MPARTSALALGLLLAITLGLAQANGKGVITASPNPVPLGPGAGRTTITWSTADGRLARVVVAVNGGLEALFAFAPYGSKEVPWIADENHYDFRLYDATSNALIASVVVRRGGTGRSPTLWITALAALAVVVAAVLAIIILRMRKRSRAPRSS